MNAMPAKSPLCAIAIALRLALERWLETGLVLGLTLLLAVSAGCGRKSAGPVDVPAGIETAQWNRLVRTYVDEKGLVDYAKWKASAPDRQALRTFLAQYAPAAPPASGTEKRASLVNAYNAFTIAWILDHYPTESIQSLPDSFGGARHRVSGRDVSLDDIEHATLRPEVGFLTHAAVSCASRSCPPLAREAFRSDRFMDQATIAMQRWLLRDDLNHFDLAAHSARISKIFDWYEEDFEKERGGLRGVLSLYAPDPYRNFVVDPKDSKIGYLPYDWGLNDQGPHGRSYGGAGAFWDRVRAKIRR